jgi:alpha-galactosidase
MTHGTASEMGTARHWTAAFDAGELPISFLYGDRAAAELIKSWPCERSSRTMDARRTEHIVSYRDPVTGLVVRGEAIEYADFPAIEWVITLENTGAADTPILADIQPLDTRFPVDPEQRCWVHHARGSQFRLEDFEPFATPLMLKVITELRLATTGGRSSDGALPFINLQMGQAGVMIAIGWTGDWAATLQRSPEEVRVAAGMQRTHLTLHPGEKIRTPRILLLFWEGERLRGHNLLRRFILTHHTPQRDGQPVLMPITDGAWGEFPVDTHLAQVQWIREHDLPAEAYWLDAGWYGDAPYDPNATVWTGTWARQVGSWYPNRRLYPHGLRPIGDALRAAGLGFALWFEPERVAHGTEIQREHPEFLAGKWFSKFINNFVYLFNLGNPEARRWMIERISTLIEEFGVTIYRQDFNMAPGPVWTEADTPDRVGMSEIRHIEGLYAFWDELLARHPGLVIDNCSSGGRRIDLESISRGITFTRSDLNDWPHDDDHVVAMQTLTHGLSLWYPVSFACTRGMDVYKMRSALGPGIAMGWSYAAIINHQDVPMDVLRPRLDELASVREYFYGDYYPLLPFSLTREAWDGWQFDRPDLGSGIVQLFRRENSPIESARLKLRGLDPAAPYEVTDADTNQPLKMSGKELMEQGLPVTITEQPAALLFRYRKGN